MDAALAEALVRKLVTLEALQLRAKILHEHGLPQPISNGFVCGYEVDLHWPDLKLVAELDGWLFHGHRRAFETDRERDLVLAAAGHRAVRVTHAQLVRRAETAARFTALLTQRS